MQVKRRINILRCLLLTHLAFRNAAAAKASALGAYEAHVVHVAGGSAGLGRLLPL